MTATRPPAVAGAFYEGTAGRLQAQVAACFRANPLPDTKERFIGGVVPHAGLMYSGHVAAAVYQLVELPPPVGILASSDLNHYEDQQTTLRKDQLAIDQVLALDPAELWRVVDDYDVSMCGFIPTTTMLIAAKTLGAARARLLKHATSGDVNGDFGHAVG